MRNERIEQLALTVTRGKIKNPPKPKPGKWTANLIIQSFEKYTRHNFIKVVEAIYTYQTDDEKRSDHTKHNNGVGFNKIHAQFMGSLVANSKRFHGSLSPKQFVVAKKIMRRYAGQLARIKNGEQ